MGLVASALGTELSQIGALNLIECGKSEEAALITYEWLMKEALPKTRRYDKDTPNLYDVLAYLIERGGTFGFNCESRIEKDRIAFEVKNDKMQNKAVSTLLELLLARIFEQLSRVEPEIAHSERYLIVKIRLPNDI